MRNSNATTPFSIWRRVMPSWLHKLTVTHRDNPWRLFQIASWPKQERLWICGKGGRSSEMVLEIGEKGLSLSTFEILLLRRECGNRIESGGFLSWGSQNGSTDAEILFESIGLEEI